MLEGLNFVVSGSGTKKKLYVLGFSDRDAKGAQARMLDRSSTRVADTRRAPTETRPRPLDINELEVVGSSTDSIIEAREVMLSGPDGIEEWVVPLSQGNLE
jgi:hypothetical protein